MKKLILFALIFAAYLNSGRISDLLTPTPEGVFSGNNQVVMYGADWCSYCARARRLFDSLGVAYIEHDIEKSSAAKAEFDRLGGRGVPLLVINNRIIKGYDRAVIINALR